MARRKKEETGGSIALTVVLVILIIALIGGLLYTLKALEVELPFEKPVLESRFEKALNENNYQAAYTVYASSKSPENELQELKEHLEKYFALCYSDEYDDAAWSRFRGIEVFNEHIKDDVLMEMDELVIRYYNDEFSEDAAEKYLSRLAKFSFTREKKTECLEYFDNKDASHKAYSDGVTLFNEGKYEEAVKSFKEVSPQDSQRYPLALEGIEYCKTEWGRIKLEEAQGMLDVYNREGAQVLLEELIALFGEYEEAEQMLLSLQPELEG